MSDFVMARYLVADSWDAIPFKIPDNIIDEDYIIKLAELVDDNNVLFGMVFVFIPGKGYRTDSLVYWVEREKKFVVESFIIDKVYKEINNKILYALFRREIRLQEPRIAERYNLEYLL